MVVAARDQRRQTRSSCGLVLLAKRFEKDVAANGAFPVNRLVLKERGMGISARRRGGRASPASRAASVVPADRWGRHRYAEPSAFPTTVRADVDGWTNSQRRPTAATMVPAF